MIIARWYDDPRIPPATAMSMTFPGGFAMIVRALRNPNFGFFMAGNAVSVIGTWMQRIAIGWLTWELTGSGTWLGVIAFADMFPTVVIGPIAGAAADRWDRLRVIKVTQTLAMAQTSILLGLALNGAVTIWHLLVLAIFLGVVNAFDQPARLALIASLVPADNLVSAVAINSVVFNLARFIGPAIAGLMIVTSGVSGVFTANAASFAFFLVALSRIRLASPKLPGRVPASFAADLLDGFRYTIAHPGIRTAFILLFALSLGGRSIAELLPGFAAAVFASGAATLATFTSAMGIGSVVAGLWLGGRGHRLGLTRVVLANALLLAFAVGLFSATDRLWVAVPALVLSGFCMSAGAIALQILIHLSVEKSMRGRVLSTFGLILLSGPALGALIIGILSEHFGFRWPMMSGSLLIAATWLWARLRYDRMAAALEPPISPVLA